MLIPSSFFRSWFTPHARGSTPLKSLLATSFRVYPACAGIDPYTVKRQLLHGSLPRMRGDRPRYFLLHGHTLQFTPHARGSTLTLSSMVDLGLVYPACAGIDPEIKKHVEEYMGLPRMRGDRPTRSAG